VIPEKIKILLSGIPATRKSTFGRYLAREHGFTHCDLECHPRGWPHPELLTSIAEAQLRTRPPN
jgi:adenylate kinase family enzyme